MTAHPSTVEAYATAGLALLALVVVFALVVLAGCVVRDWWANRRGRS